MALMVYIEKLCFDAGNSVDDGSGSGSGDEGYWSGSGAVPSKHLPCTQILAHETQTKLFQTERHHFHGASVFYCWYVCVTLYSLAGG